jgi:predicted phosphoribosyltransferase
LGRALTASPRADNTLVLALPRGGVPVAYEVAEALNAPLDIFLVRKLGVPGHEELAMGAIASGGIRVLNDDVVGLLGLRPQDIESVAAREVREIERRERAYRDDRPPPQLRGRDVIPIDDGLATGSTMRAAAAAVRTQGAARITIAVPPAAEATCDAFRREVDEVVCVQTPEPFHAVGLWYRDFTQTTDDEVRALLAAHARHQSSAATRSRQASRRRQEPAPRCPALSRDDARDRAITGAGASAASSPSPVARPGP